MKNTGPLTRIGAHIFKAPSAENWGKKSGTRERAQVGASDLQASPLSEGDRRLWVIYSKWQREVQAVGASWGQVHGGVDISERGGGVLRLYRYGLDMRCPQSLRNELFLLFRIRASWYTKTNHRTPGRGMVLRRWLFVLPARVVVAYARSVAESTILRSFSVTISCILLLPLASFQEALPT